jgi:lysophospholipase L1-like esterase
MLKRIIFSCTLFAISTVVALGLAEGVLRVKNSSMKNYDIEMWRYAKELKVASPDPKLGHDHIKQAEALLQSVTIRLNERGLRGGPLAAHPSRRILFLGSSITLGWGVKEEDTVSARVQQILRQQDPNVEVLNGGVGNYNAERYVERFMTELKDLDPTDIVVQCFVRDAEQLDAGGGNALLRNSELAVTLWIALDRLKSKTGETALVQHYADLYRDDQPGFIAMKNSLRELADYAKAHNIRIYLAMTPDVHDLKNYQLGFVHERVKRIAEQDGYRFIDLLPAFGALSPEQVWAMPGDPHPNALGHALMAKAIAPALALPPDNLPVTR